MSKIYTILALGSGLGNKLYQVFALLHYAKLLNREPIVIDIENKLSDGEKELLKNFKIINSLPNDFFVYREKSFNKYMDISSINTNYENPIICVGYFLNLDILDSPANMREVLNIPTPVSNKTVIHIRGGDYLNSEYINLTKEYYEQAIKNLGVSKEDCIILTNDSEYAKSILPNIEISQGTLLEDFMKIVNAKNIVLSNSTFSTFAAYLSEADKVIYPKEYFKDNRVMNIYMPDWYESNI